MTAVMSKLQNNSRSRHGVTGCVFEDIQVSRIVDSVYCAEYLLCCLDWRISANGFSDTVGGLYREGGHVMLMDHPGH